MDNSDYHHPGYCHNRANQEQAGIRMQAVSMTNQPEQERKFIDKGTFHHCAEGKAIYDKWDKILFDDTVTAFCEEFVEAWDAWLEHRKTCDKCGVW